MLNYHCQSKRGGPSPTLLQQAASIVLRHKMQSRKAALAGMGAQNLGGEGLGKLAPSSPSSRLPVGQVSGVTAHYTALLTHACFCLEGGGGNTTLSSLLVVFFLHVYIDFFHNWTG